MMIALGPATLRASIPSDTVTKLQAIPSLSAKDQQAAMNTIVKCIEADEHLTEEGSRRLLSAAVVVAFSSDPGKALRATDLSGATLAYTITPLATPNDYDWRLAVLGVGGSGS